MNVQSQTSKPFTMQTGIAKGHRICAIGDVHGNATQMAALLDNFQANNDDYFKTTLVILGDLNDRGHENLRAFDLAIEAKTRFDEVITLQGNHEAMLRIVLNGNQAKISALWNKHGGQDVLAEIGFDKINFGNKDKFKASLAHELGKPRLDYLNSLCSHHQVGNLLFVHAGTDPKNSIDDHFSQPWDQCFGNHWCWIREPFLQNPVKFSSHPNLTVVHGHTPVQKSPYKPQDDLFSGHIYADGKLNLDGGSYRSGCVTGAEFTHNAYRLHCAVIYL